MEKIITAEELMKEFEASARMLTEVNLTETELENIYKFRLCDTPTIMDSLIIKNPLVQAELSSLLWDNAEFNLLYRGSKDGFTHQAFHSKCDKQGPTIVIIRSHHDKTFGGFTDISWHMGAGSLKQKSRSFLFSLRKDRRFEVMLHVKGKTEIKCHT